jgi:hypothetical protein
VVNYLDVIELYLKGSAEHEQSACLAFRYLHFNSAMFFRTCKLEKMFPMSINFKCGLKLYIRSYIQSGSGETERIYE